MKLSGSASSDWRDGGICCAGGGKVYAQYYQWQSAEFRLSIHRASRRRRASPKTRYGFEWFEAKWKEALGEISQESLFE
jgi:hypothetical protein